MKYSATVLALASGALAHSSRWVAWPTNGTHVALETIVTTAYTTYCPEATEVVQNGKTYTVIEATTLTITDCPCTFTRPIATPSTVLYTGCPPRSSGEEATATAPAQVPANNAPVYVNPLTVSYTPTVKPTGTGSYTTKPAAAEYTGAASANKIGSFVVGAAAGVIALAL